MKGTLIATAVGLVLAARYVIHCAWWPWAPCRRCGRSGVRWAPSGKAFRQCRRCKGSGRRVRLGRRLWDWYQR
jgi:hypothetical protein